MIRVNIADAKARFSKLLKAVREGEAVIVCERNVAIAELRPLPAARRGKRPLGPEQPGFVLPEAFFDPLPDELANAFEGHAP